MTIIFLQQEEQQRLQRLQQAQRDAFASEVLKEFDLGQLNEIKDGFDQEDEDQKFETREREKMEKYLLSGIELFFNSQQSSD